MQEVTDQLFLSGAFIVSLHGGKALNLVGHQGCIWGLLLVQISRVKSLGGTLEFFSFEPNFI